MNKTITKKDGIKGAISILEKRVEKGIRHLDKKVGRNKWLNRIDIKVLDLSDNKKCICGQVFGDYFDYLSDGAFNDDLDESSFYGFNIHDEDYDDFPIDLMDLLTHLWYCKVFSLKFPH